MRKLYIVALVTFAIFSTSTEAAVITDGDFSMWSFGSVGTATVSREDTDGNPGARLNITTVSGPQAFGTAIKSDFSTNLSLAGNTFELQLDVLSGPGSFDEGQRIYLLVEQNSSIYGASLDITGFPLNWDTLSFTGSFLESSFSLLSGSGSTTPDFSGGINTYFGFAGANSISGTLTQYYDNFSLDIAAVPLPPALWLFGSGLIGLIGIARRKKS